MRIWIVTEFYDSPADTVGGYYVKGLAEKLASTENVEVVFPSKNSFSGVNSDNRIRIHKIHQFSFNRQNLITRTFGQIIISLQFFFFLLSRVKKDDMVISFTHPTFFIFISSFLKKLKKTKTTVVNYDLFPEILVGTSVSGESSFYRLILKMFNRAYNNADIIISLGKDMTRIFNDKIRNNTTKIYTIPNWTDLDSIYFQPKEENEIILKYGLESKIVFSYAGTIGRCQGIDKLLKLIDNIDYNNKIHFLFFGKGIALNSFLKQISENRNRGLITYGGFIVTEDRKKFINACDVGIISLLDGMTGLNFPSKTYNILASGHPVLFAGNRNSELGEIITGFDIGWVCPSFNTAMFQGIINEIIDNPAVIRSKGEKARMIAEKYFAREIILSQYYNAIIPETY